MFGMLKNLTKVVVGVAIETPLAMAADVVTMGGVLTDRDKSYTAEAISKVVENVENSTKTD